jgi:hypothetical protein
VLRTFFASLDANVRCLRMADAIDEMFACEG